MGAPLAGKRIRLYTSLYRPALGGTVTSIGKRNWPSGGMVALSHLYSHRRRVPVSKSIQRTTTRTSAGVQARVPRFLAQKTTGIFPLAPTPASVPATSTSALSALGEGGVGVEVGMGCGAGVGIGNGVGKAVGRGAAPGLGGGAGGGRGMGSSRFWQTLPFRFAGDGMCQLMGLKLELWGAAKVATHRERGPFLG